LNGFDERLCLTASVAGFYQKTFIKPSSKKLLPKSAHQNA